MSASRSFPLFDRAIPGRDRSDLRTTGWLPAGACGSGALDVSQVFPKWTNLIPKVAAPVGVLLLVGVCWGYMYYVDEKFFMVGYEPQQPVDYSHQIHAGKLGMDCRYCHSHIEESYSANIPATQTCINCHAADEASDQALLSADLWKSHKVNKNLIKVRTAFATGEPIEWRRVHKLPDYVNFPHDVHLHAGISCYSCHGRVDQLAIVRDNEPLQMAWCLDCHRHPERKMIDNKGDLGTPIKVTDLMGVSHQLASGDQADKGARLAEVKQIQPPQNCGACHY